MSARMTRGRVLWLQLSSNVALIVGLSRWLSCWALMLGSRFERSLGSHVRLSPLSGANSTRADCCVRTERRHAAQRRGSRQTRR